MLCNSREVHAVLLPGSEMSSSVVATAKRLYLARFFRPRKSMNIVKLAATEIREETMIQLG